MSSTTPDTDDLDLIGCDHCDFTSIYEDDFASLGGDRETGYGLVAYPTTCNDCQDAEIKKAERLYSTIRYTRPDLAGLYE